MKSTNSKSPYAPTEREQRVADALRDNLRKRKAQQQLKQQTVRLSASDTKEEK